MIPECPLGETLAISKRSRKPPACPSTSGTLVGPSPAARGHRLRQSRAQLSQRSQYALNPIIPCIWHSSRQESPLSPKGAATKFRQDPFGRTLGLFVLRVPAVSRSHIYRVGVDIVVVSEEYAPKAQGPYLHSYIDGNNWYCDGIDLILFSYCGNTQMKSIWYNLKKIKVDDIWIGINQYFHRSPICSNSIVIYCYVNACNPCKAYPLRGPVPKLWHRISIFRNINSTHEPTRTTFHLSYSNALCNKMSNAECQINS